MTYPSSQKKKFADIIRPGYTPVSNVHPTLKDLYLNVHITRRTSKWHVCKNSVGNIWLIGNKIGLNGKMQKLVAEMIRIGQDGKTVRGNGMGH